MESSDHVDREEAGTGSTIIILNTTNIPRGTLQYEHSIKSKSVIPAAEWSLEVGLENQGWKISADRWK